MSLLDQYDQMQRRPFGTNTALSNGSQYGTGGTAGSQIRKQGSAYARALRVLDRQARRGDARSALAAIETRKEANQMGFSPGGIQRKSEVDAGTMGQIAAMEQSNVDTQRAQQVGRDRISGLLGEKPFGRSAPAAAEEVVVEEFQAPNNRLYAGLDVLESRSRGAMDAFDQASQRAKDLGVEDPNTILQGNSELKYRQTLDSALGQAKTPEEIAALKARGTRYGVPAKAFDRRAKWWETNRR